MNSFKFPKIFYLTHYLLFIILALYATIGAREFLYPPTLAILFAFLLYPIANFFERNNVPRIIANILSIILVLGVLSIGIYFFYHKLVGIISDFPTLKTKSFQNIDRIGAFLETNIGIEQTSQRLYAKQAVARFFETSNKLLGNLFKETTGAFIRIVIIPVLIFFFLFYRDKFNEFFFMVTREKHKQQMKSIIGDVSQVMEKYMGGMFIVVSILCILNPLALWIVGIEYPIILGVIAAICNFIPYFGTIIGFSFPLVFALLIQSPHVAIGVAISFFIVQFIENNILTPNIVGGNVKLNPLVIILSLICGAMVWGLPGMIVVVPIVAIIRIIFENIDDLKPYAYLLGTDGTEKHSLTFGKIKIFMKKFRRSK